MAMNPEIKARWVAALRSGEYRQTTQVLKNRSGHCCLGVLCDLFAQDAGMKRWGKKSLSDAADGFDAFHWQDAGIPRITVCMWSQLDPDTKVVVDGQASTLFNHNDGGRTFAEIADAIEAQL